MLTEGYGSRSGAGRQHAVIVTRMRNMQEQSYCSILEDYACLIDLFSQKISVVFSFTHSILPALLF